MRLPGFFYDGDRRGAQRRATVGGILLISAHLGWLFVFDLRAHPLAFYGFFALALTGWVYGARALSDVESPRLGAWLAVAVVVRALLVPVPPSLSDDVYRYVWDGRVLAAGLDPYAHSPDAAELAHLRDDLWQRLAHRDVATVYPPLSLAVFSIAARTPAPVLAVKLALVLADLIACYLLWCLAIRRAAPPGAVAWYAWSPLVTLEVAGMAHVDALGVPFVVLTWLWLAAGGRRATWGAAASAAGAVLVKLVPLIAVPVWARASRRPIRYLVASGLLSAAIALPVMARDGMIPSGLVRYGVSWEFNGPVYELLWRALDAAGSADWIEGRLDAIKQASGEHERWNRFYPYNYARLHAKLVLLVLLGVAALAALRERDPVIATGRLFGAALVLSATVYPWYLLWVLPWAALERRRSWLTLAATLPLCYLPQFTEIELVPYVLAAIWLPFFALLALDARSRP